MYSRKAWGGNTDPYILTKFITPDEVEGDPTVSLVVFEWSDRDLIGHVTEERNEYGYEEVSGHTVSDVERRLRMGTAARS